MTEFQNRFNQIIQNSNLKQVEIAEALGIHPPTLSKYIHGNSGMSLETLYKFCIAFNVSADWLLGIDRGEEIAKVNYESAQMRNAVYKAGKALEKEGIADDERQKIIEQLQSLIDQLK